MVYSSNFGADSQFEPSLIVKTQKDQRIPSKRWASLLALNHNAALREPHKQYIPKFVY